MEAVILIDYTYDFVADDGKLTCGPPGQVLEDRIDEIIKTHVAKGDYIVVANDIHPEEDPNEYHPETKLFPPHNIAGTSGRDLYGRLKETIDEIEKETPELLHRMDKTRYSAFVGTDLELRLRERNIKTIHLLGVCTDICILHTAIEGFNKGFNIVIHEDGVASFNPAGHEFALEHFKNVLGAEVRSSKA